MQQPQSSSTLQNYISSGQNQQDSSHPNHQTSSSCVECQHITKLQKDQGSDSDSGSSSGDDGQLVQPLHRHIIQHSRQIEATITNLQLQIQKLKKANSTKDSVIEELKRQLKQVQMSKISHSKNQDVQQAQFLRRQKQIEKIRQQLYRNSQNIMNGNKLISNNGALNGIVEMEDENSMNQDLKKRMKNIEVMFEDKCTNQIQKGNKEDNRKNHKKIKYTKRIQVGPASDSQQQSLNGQQNKRNLNRRDFKQQEQQDLSKKSYNKKTSSNQENQRHLTKQRISNQQTQNKIESKDSSIQYELNNQYEKIARLQKHIQFCEDQMVWMSNFIVSFLRMSQKLMINFKQPVLKQHWSMKKKTKISWRYIKHILSYLIR